MLECVEKLFHASSLLGLRRAARWPILVQKDWTLTSTHEPENKEIFSNLTTGHIGTF